MDPKEVLEGGTVKSVNDGSLVVEVEGVELFVHTSINYRRYGDKVKLNVSYNKLLDERYEKYGEADPLDIK